MAGDVQVFTHEGPVPRSWAAGTISDGVHIAPQFSDSTRTRLIGTESDYWEFIGTRFRLLQVCGFCNEVEGVGMCCHVRWFDQLRLSVTSSLLLFRLEPVTLLPLSIPHSLPPLCQASDR